ncbi:MAG: hypothetical protein HYR85_27240 [Planctomycetes bacterium]|nr:hypothetical protein [Planctomycetota bacterium]
MKRACLVIGVAALVGGALASVVASSSPDALEHLTEQLTSGHAVLGPRGPFGSLPPPPAGAIGVGVTLALLTIVARLLFGGARPLDPRIKIALVVAYAVLLSTVGREGVWKLGFVAVVASIATLALGVPLRRLRLLLPVLAVAGFAAASWAIADRTQGLQRGALLLAKAVLSAHAVILLRHTTPSAEIWQGLGGLGVPRSLVLAALLLERSIATLGDEARALDLAIRARAGSRSRRVSGAALGSLFSRTLDRAERVRLSLEARGFDPERTSANETIHALHPADAIFAGSAALLLAVVACL